MKYKEWIELWFENYVKPTSKQKPAFATHRSYKGK